MIKPTIKRVLAGMGLEVTRKRDPSLPLLHQIIAEKHHFPFWIANSFTKEWWCKAELPLVGEFSELMRLSRAGDTVLEIGAHHGMMTILLASWIGDEGRIHAIEASADNALVLDANCFRSQAANVITSFVAMGSSEGTARFGGESLAAKSGIVREVAMTTIDAYCRQKHVESVDLLKIDVEGYEMDVLRGAQDLLQQQPKLALELHLDDLPSAGSSAREVWDFLEDHGMLAGRSITMVARPQWEKVTAVTSFADLPKTGVVNLFIGD